jgi:DNA-binding transcriptional ArsR family regulator
MKRSSDPGSTDRHHAADDEQPAGHALRAWRELKRLVVRGGLHVAPFRDGLRAGTASRFVEVVVDEQCFDFYRNSVASKLDRHAEQLGALGHPSRLSILRYVVQGGADGTPAGEIQSKLDIPASTLSHHLERLTSAGLLTSRREGTFIYYSAEYAELKVLTEYLWEDCCKRGSGAKGCG